MPHAWRSSAGCCHLSSRSGQRSLRHCCRSRGVRQQADKPIPLNQAIVVQIWLIFFGSEACTELADAGPAGFYRALGALALGEALPLPSPAELDRLRVDFERKQRKQRTGSRRPGRVIQFGEMLSVKGDG